MPLSWNEIKSRALAFSKEWEDGKNEEADAKPFLVEFLNVFGITRKRVATFEHRVKKLSEGDGYIDMIWKGMLLIEMKSKGKNLDKAYIQAKEYCHGLKEYDLPKMIMICDFERFHIYDEDGNKTEFTLKELVKNVQIFSPIAGYQKRTYKEQDPVNIQAAELMGKLHDKLKEIGYDGHALELYLVRLLFCLFADDTSIFEKGIFHDLIELKTNEDGSDLAAHITQLFWILNTPEDKRLKNLDDDLNVFPYVNGKLFEENLPMASFDSEMRTILLQSCRLDWGRISPAIFGSLFQSVMDEKARRNLGAHYTSEKNILKLIKPLFLDELWKEFESSKSDKNKLKKLHDKISKLRFLDPACGCGNFLIISYRELRLLELEIVSILLKGQQVTSINDYFLLDVDQFYGIEYEEFPSQIAQVAMWLMDHQMNEIASVKFGDYYKRIPLKKSATIVCGNALRIDWQSLIVTYPWEKHAAEYQFILGNPPFIGKQYQTKEQKQDLLLATNNLKGYTDLDYVSGWFFKAAQYSNQNQTTRIAFVSTSSITQGEQVAILWSTLIYNLGMKINFAHKSFKWNNEARGIAAVTCIIVGFSYIDDTLKRLFEYETPASEPLEIMVSNINPYLSEGKNVIIQKRNTPICDVPQMRYGNKPTDDGNFIFTNEEKEEFVKQDPNSLIFFRRYTGSEEYLYNNYRWCLWLHNADPSLIKKSPLVLERISNVKKFRLKSTALPTRKSADFPSLFFYISQPDTDYLIIPETSSENRKYIPIGYVSGDIIASNAVYLIPDASLYIFGVLISSMHMAWMRYTCGRLESRYRYTGSIVYNNFPWPLNVSDKKKENVENAARLVLKTRTLFSQSNLAELYDVNSMPPQLTKAHQLLDTAVELCYSSKKFDSDSVRIKYLFDIYSKFTADIFEKENKKQKK